MGDTIRICYAFEDSITTQSLEATIEWLRGRFEVRHTRIEPFDENVSAIVKDLLEGNGVLRVTGEPLETSLAVDTRTAGIEPPNVGFRFKDHQFRPDSQLGRTVDDVISAVEAIIDLAVGLYGVFVRKGLAPQYVLGLDIVDMEFLSIDTFDLSTERQALLGNGIRQIFWFQIVPPAIVDRTDEDLLESVPAWTVRRLEDGAVLLVCHPHPTPTPETDDQERTDEVRAHFGVER